MKAAGKADEMDEKGGKAIKMGTANTPPSGGTKFARLNAGPETGGQRFSKPGFRMISLAGIIL